MRCVSEIRADESRPFRCLMLAYTHSKRQPKAASPTHKPVHDALGRVYSTIGESTEAEYRQDALRLPIGLRTRGRFSGPPQGFEPPTKGL